MKYSLTNNTKTWNGVTLFQIKAEISFGSISKGELGGYIEKEGNLSQAGNAWVSGNAQVSLLLYSTLMTLTSPPSGGKK